MQLSRELFTCNYECLRQSHFHLLSVRILSRVSVCISLSVRLSVCLSVIAFSALTLLVGRQEGHPVCKKTGWSGAGVVICLERGADLHLAQLMPLPLTVSCFSKIQIGFTFLVRAHPGSPGQTAIKRVCVCVSQLRCQSYAVCCLVCTIASAQYVVQQ